MRTAPPLTSLLRLCLVAAYVACVASEDGEDPALDQWRSTSWAVRESMRSCFTDIAPNAFYKFGEAAGPGHLERIRTIVDRDGFTWVMKECEDPGDPEWAEVQIMQQVMPFNMVLHEVYSTVKAVYLVMPMLPHRSLNDWLFVNNATPTLEQARSIAAQIAFGIWELHQRGLMHRDLKIANVMMLDELADNVTLIDYNRAAFGCRGKRGEACTRTIAGTAGSLAWSTKAGKPYSYEVDWWSFGVILHVCALWELPFEKSVFRFKRPPNFLNVTALDGKDQALVNLLKSTISVGYLSLRTQEARVAMESPTPEAHPILNSDFWLAGAGVTPETRTNALRDYWSGVCKTHAADPEVHCAHLFKEKPTEHFKRLCNEVATASCCCRRSACTRNATAHLSDLGVDRLPAVEGSSGNAPVCCARQLKCGGTFPYLSTSIGGNASCI